MFGYYTPKVVWVRNRNLGLLRLILVLAILIYIVYGVIILQRRYNYEETPLGTVEVSLQAPNKVVDPAAYPYCDQYNGSATQKVMKRECFSMHALEVLYPFEDTGGVFVTTRISTQENERACELAQACKNQFQPTSSAIAGFVADVESFTLRIRHSMQALKLYQKYHSPEYGGNSDRMVGRLIRTDGSFVKYITSPIFSVGELLEAAQTKLEDPSDALGAEDTSMRDSGIIIVITLAYSNEETTLPVYDMQVTRVAFSEYKITHLDRVNNTAYNIVGLHGIKFIFIQTGTIVRFDFQVLLMSLVTSTALLAAATSVVEFIMLKVSPLKALYMEHKFEPTMEIHELESLKKILRKQSAMSGVRKARLLQLSQFAFMQYQSMDRTPTCSKEEIGAITRSIHKFRQDQERKEREERERLARVKKRVRICGCCCPKPDEKKNKKEEEDRLLTDKQFVRSQHEQIFQLLEQDGVIHRQSLDTLLTVGGADTATKQLLNENGMEGDLTHDQFVDLLTLLGQLEKVKIGAGVPCVQLFSGENALDRLYEKLSRHMQASTPPPPTISSPLPASSSSSSLLPPSSSSTTITPEPLELEEEPQPRGGYCRTQ